jgi:predicted nucleic acid-binding protein
VRLILDAGPLIHLSKLDALDVLEKGGWEAMIPPSVRAEAARPELAFRHTEVAVIMRALDEGRVSVAPLTEAEDQLAGDLAGRATGLHAGELEVLALGLARAWPVCLHERQASRIAGALGIRAVHVMELLFDGTPDRSVLAKRLRAFGGLTNMRASDLNALLEIADERS